ncbi:hypothetical protein BFT35_02405 [Thermoanaerobacterium thermosaccharolyticum]|uniref:DUF6612 family protein n=1 Tax=Thermoanaerobacterium thermosaccharolyticum TaxID=1517 RepID=UPI000C06868F|nr:DUF6612 family protein [Thermoanaerobacterium thermosaccharolyticum]PHO07926.1 hypothetical protein BFT35_02405 [Thermoanaerobacterium thermosaccharolyticum]
MKKYVSLFLVTMMIAAIPVIGLAAQPGSNYMTRQEFLNDLIKEAGIDLGGKDVSQYVVDNRILEGDGKGNLLLSEPITYEQIATILSRFYGLSMIDAHQVEGSEYVYALEEGLIPQDAPLNEKVTEDEGQQILSKIFDNYSKVKDLIDDTKNTTVKSGSLNGNMKVNVGFNNGASSSSFDTVSAQVYADYNLDQGIHEVLSMSIPNADSMTVEEYIMGDKVYVKSPDGEWSYMTVPGMSNIMNLEKLQQNNLLSKDVLYRYAGTSYLNGKAVNVVYAYTKITDMSKVDDLINTLGLGNLLEGMKYSDLFDGLYGKYVYYIDANTNTVSKLDMLLKIAYKQGAKVGGVEMPLKWEMVSGSIVYSNVNGNINVVLPDDAKNAKELTVPAQN